ncbi:MAG: hypothetical protein K2W95_21180 [Candidatus Obscuribacterales bacterium]|nr:hypothetical protein [Candidatus Obscuribacterales bacterium]
MNPNLGKTSVGVALLAAMCFTSVPASFGEKLLIPPIERVKVYSSPVKIQQECVKAKQVECKVTVERPCAALKSTEKVTETISESWSKPAVVRKRSSFKRAKRMVRRPTHRRVARRPLVRTRIVTNTVRVERTKFVEKIVKKPVYIDRIVEKPVYIEKCVEKPVYIDRCVEKPVLLERPIILKKKRSHFIRLGTPLFSVGLL